MIKFFRKIRQNLLMENKTGKYFKYAIGEIVLVVIGILIALQINNWNELKKLKEKENVFLKEIISDLNYNEQRTVHFRMDSIAKIYDYVIQHLENKLPYDNSLSRHFYIIQGCPGLS